MLKKKREKIVKYPVLLNYVGWVEVKYILGVFSEYKAIS